MRTKEEFSQHQAIIKDSIIGRKLKDHTPNGGRPLDTNDISDSIDFEYDLKGTYTMPTPPPKLCPFCNEEWTPRMEELLVSSGYCETCYNEDTFGVIVCEKCNRIVYRK